MLERIGKVSQYSQMWIIANMKRTYAIDIFDDQEFYIAKDYRLYICSVLDCEGRKACFHSLTHEYRPTCDMVGQNKKCKCEVIKDENNRKKSFKNQYSESSQGIGKDN
jgi:hypothetical protein